MKDDGSHMSRIFIGIIIFITLFLSACQNIETIPTETQTPTPTSEQNSSLSTVSILEGTQTPMKPQNSQILIIAHRGARSLAPENTLMAAQKGYDVGADMWELDVAMTRDNQLVVIHDDNLKRTSNAVAIYPTKSPWYVRTFTLEELRKLDFGSWFIATDPFKTIKDGLVSVEDQEKMKGITIPTLEEALVLTKNLNWRVNIEIKDLSKTPDDDAVVVEMVVSLVEKLDMVDSVIISSFKHDYLTQVKKINPKIDTAALVEQGFNDPVSLLVKLGAQAYNPGISGLYDWSTIQNTRDAGYDVYVWTVNDEMTMNQLIDAGVSGIFTDFPQVGVEVLKQK